MLWEHLIFAITKELKYFSTETRSFYFPELTLAVLANDQPLRKFLYFYQN